MELRAEINHFLGTLNRSPKTIFAYRNALEQFVKIVGEGAELNTDTYIKFLIALRQKSPSTQGAYRTAVLKLYKFCRVGNWPELEDATEHYTRKPGTRIVNVDMGMIETVINYCDSLGGDVSTSSRERLEALRDRAFVLTLADAGLRISEACALKRGDIDWPEQRSIIIGKGDKQAVIRYSNRAIEALKAYLHARASVEPNSRTPLGSQPLFARHDIRASKRIRAITPGGMWKAIKSRIEEAGLDRNAVRIHDFRHYFVSATYIDKRDIKISQQLARHESIATTNRYTHLISDLDQAYDEIFNKK